MELWFCENCGAEMATDEGYCSQHCMEMACVGECSRPNCHHCKHPEPISEAELNALIDHNESQRDAQHAQYLADCR